MVLQVDPTNESKHGMKFSEWRSDLSIADIALNHSQAKVESAQFPVMPKIPFFMEISDWDGVLRSVTIYLAINNETCLEGMGL